MANDNLWTIGIVGGGNTTKSDMFDSGINAFSKAVATFNVNDKKKDLFYGESDIQFYTTEGDPENFRYKKSSENFKESGFNCTQAEPIFSYLMDSGGEVFFVGNKKFQDFTKTKNLVKIYDEYKKTIDNNPLRNNYPQKPEDQGYNDSESKV